MLLGVPYQPAQCAATCPTACACIGGHALSLRSSVGRSHICCCCCCCCYCFCRAMVCSGLDALQRSHYLVLVILLLYLLVLQRPLTVPLQRPADRHQQLQKLLLWLLPQYPRCRKSALPSKRRGLLLFVASPVIGHICRGKRLQDRACKVSTRLPPRAQWQSCETTHTPESSGSSVAATNAILCMQSASSRQTQTLCLRSIGSYPCAPSTADVFNACIQQNNDVYDWLMWYTSGTRAV
jgi:hypothetical protein